MMKELKIKTYRGKCEPIKTGKHTLLKLYDNCLQVEFDYHYVRLHKGEIPIKKK